VPVYPHAKVHIQLEYWVHQQHNKSKTQQTNT